MFHRNTALRLAVPTAVLALALTACGGGDSKSEGSDDKPKDGAASSQPKEEKLAAGASTTGKVEEDGAAVTYDVAAQKVDLGTAADAKKLVQDPEDAKGLVPAVAHIKFTHKGGAPLTDTPDVADTTEVWADGTRGGLLIGAAEDAQGCEDPLDLEGWKKGESHVLCETYLVPESAKNLEVHWAEKDDAKPAIWSLPAE
ncbi:lipoprotein [Streptomyces durmitorensis]|uniref:Lipoprotein n=1 Tax=Streptomyces durmitorensis TaxID=319947 RepID=A0ABY4PMD9_9ACTN|nr:hypothetical protein [Streptomyces durmitorensis]UQT54118.1 hypothetical protein M4V62_02935 [Streptomyces durmitorensis]